MDCFQLWGRDKIKSTATSLHELNGHSDFAKQKPTTLHVPPVNTRTSLPRVRINKHIPSQKVSFSPAYRLVASYCSVFTPSSRRKFEIIRICVRVVMVSRAPFGLISTGEISRPFHSPCDRHFVCGHKAVTDRIPGIGLPGNIDSFLGKSLPQGRITK
jgi:hypothetical protein